MSKIAVDGSVGGPGCGLLRPRDVMMEWDMIYEWIWPASSMLDTLIIQRLDGSEQLRSLHGGVLNSD